MIGWICFALVISWFLVVSPMLGKAKRLYRRLFGAAWFLWVASVYGRGGGSPVQAVKGLPVIVRCGDGFNRVQLRRKWYKVGRWKLPERK